MTLNSQYCIHRLRERNKRIDPRCIASEQSVNGCGLHQYRLIEHHASGEEHTTENEWQYGRIVLGAVRRQQQQEF